MTDRIGAAANTMRRAVRFVATLDRYLSARDHVRNGNLHPDALAEHVRASEALIEATMRLDMSLPPFPDIEPERHAEDPRVEDAHL